MRMRANTIVKLISICTLLETVKVLNDASERTKWLRVGGARWAPPTQIFISPEQVIKKNSNIWRKDW